jgi:hypothetical protein
VRDGDVSALRAVLMVVPLMGCVLAGAAFVGVIAVDPVDVAVVGVVGVVVVLECDVAAVIAMGVRVIGVRGVLAGVRHSGSPSLGTGAPFGPCAAGISMARDRRKRGLSIRSHISIWQFVHN